MDWVDCKSDKKNEA